VAVVLLQAADADLQFLLGLGQAVGVEAQLPGQLRVELTDPLEQLPQAMGFRRHRLHGCAGLGGPSGLGGRLVRVGFRARGRLIVG